MSFPAAVDSVESNGTANPTFAADTSIFPDADLGELLMLTIFMPTAANMAMVPPNEDVEWFGAGGLNQNAGAQIFTKFADGSEGATTTLTEHAGGTKALWVLAERFGTSAAKWTRPVGTQASGYDAPSFNPTPWDTEDTLWRLAACSVADAGSVPSGWVSVWEPAATMMLCEKEENAASQDAATTSGSNDGVVVVAAIRPRPARRHGIILM